ncbi:MAG: TonB-dependent receptor plug domain-containing protein, partial [Bacteroidetes bacterium]|nr:TonB-dependent receptor plug domain-containing protein [Bacteroidota bacterium]
MFRINKVILIFVCLMSFCAQGQISGIVLDKNTETPIEYATIVLKQEGQILEGSVSKPDGSFLLPISNDGNFTVEIRFLGYQKLETENVVAQKNTPLDLGVIGLQTSQNILDEVVVDAQQTAVLNKIDRQIYSASEFTSARGGTGIDVVRNLPSLSFNGLGEISLRGSTGFVLLLNNKPIQSDLQSLLIQIPANSIKRIEIITSPSAQYDADGKAGI